MLQCVVVAVCGSCGVKQARCGKIVVWGSRNVGELQCGGVAVWGSGGVGDAVWGSLGVGSPLRDPLLLGLKQDEMRSLITVHFCNRDILCYPWPIASNLMDTGVVLPQFKKKKYTKNSLVNFSGSLLMRYHWRKAIKKYMRHVRFPFQSSLFWVAGYVCELR